MKVVSKHGFIRYYPNESWDLVRFKRIFGIDLVREDDYFTFEFLKGLPRHSIAGMPYANLPAIATYEGRDAAEVMLKNQFVYHMQFGILMPLASVPNSVAINETLSYGVAGAAFVQPGARLNGTLGRVLSYSGNLDLDFQRLYIYDRELV